jgi:hypothetical protein
MLHLKTHQLLLTRACAQLLALTTASERILTELQQAASSGLWASNKAWQRLLWRAGLGSQTPYGLAARWGSAPSKKQVTCLQLGLRVYV